VSLKKILIALAALAALAFLFVRSAQDARSEAYSVSASHLKNWTVGINTAGDADGALVSLRPPPELPMNFFRQLFSRQMESMGTPSQPGIPLVLRHEIPGDVTADEVVALARAAGLEQATLTPKCVGYRRISDPGITRQLYFLWFDVPGFDRFRQSLAAQAGPAFNPAAMSAVLAMAAAPDFVGWLPIAADEARDCIASVDVR
jgi:hypothetical protein